MKRSLQAMDAFDIVFWVIESIPGAVLISVVLTLTASILLDIELKSAGLLGFLLKFLPGFLLGILIMMAVGYFFGSMFGALFQALFKLARFDRK